MRTLTPAIEEIEVPMHAPSVPQESCPVTNRVDTTTPPVDTNRVGSSVPPVHRSGTDLVVPNVPPAGTNQDPPVHRSGTDLVVPSPPVRRSARARVERKPFQAKLSGKAHE